MSTLTTREARLRRHRRVRKHVQGSAECPRLAVFRSNKGIAAQLIDDNEAKTIAARELAGAAEVVQGLEDGAGGRGREAARREREEGRRRDRRLRPRRLPLPRSRQGARRRRARGRVGFLDVR
jgi:large subunit ribosomal protein L18